MVSGKIVVAGCKHTTRDLIEGLTDRGFGIDACLTINPNKGDEQKVAGYFDLREFLIEKQINCLTANKYNLNSEEDKTKIQGIKIDILLVMGWQRLIPDWFLNHLKYGAFSMHGSSKSLPHGRGRSPMNWSLIQGKQEFYTHFFKYRSGVDDGPVVGCQKFDITPWDDAHTLHLKNLLSMIRLCEKHIPKIIDGTCIYTEQPSEGASYYPKRAAEDGIIIWPDTTQQIHDLVRAVTRPFPGAFTFLGEKEERKIIIWELIPFDSQLRWDHLEPGTIIDIFYDGSFVAKTGSTSVLVKKYDGNVTRDDVGRKFSNGKYQQKIWENLPK